HDVDAEIAAKARVVRRRADRVERERVARPQRGQPESKLVETAIVAVVRKTLGFDRCDSEAGRVRPMRVRIIVEGSPHEAASRAAPRLAGSRRPVPLPTNAPAPNPNSSRCARAVVVARFRQRGCAGLSPEARPRAVRIARGDHRGAPGVRQRRAPVRPFRSRRHARGRCRGAQGGLGDPRRPPHLLPGRRRAARGRSARSTRDPRPEGRAEVRKAGSATRADRLTYYQADDELLAAGRVRVTRQGNVFTGPQLALKLDANTGWFESPSYYLAAYDGR